MGAHFCNTTIVTREEQRVNIKLDFEQLEHLNSDTPTVSRRKPSHERKRTSCCGVCRLNHRSVVLLMRLWNVAEHL